jgi:hypothetical protein
VRRQFLARKKVRPKSGKQPNLAEKVRPHAAACGQSQKNGPPHAAACGEITSKFGRTFQHWSKMMSDGVEKHTTF